MKNLRSLLVVSLLAFAISAHAQTSDNLQHLVSTNGSLSLGDKTFSNFSFSQTGLTNFDPSQVNASVSLLGGVYFLSITGNISYVGAGPGTASFLLDYVVTASAGQIDMIDQSFTGSSQPGSGFLAIDETVRNPLDPGSVVANSHLQNDDISDPTAEANDHLNLPPGLAQLEITTGIGFGLISPGFDTVSQFRQSFHQVPEGGTTALFVIGLGTVALVLLRKKASA